MGTHCSIHVKENYGDNTPYLMIYTQFDGYFSGVGKNIKLKFANHQIVDGYNSSNTMENTANGIGCFAAQLVAHLKTRIGNIYIENSEQIESYHYVLYCRDNKIYISASINSEEMYNGPLCDFNYDMEDETIL